MQIRFTKMNGAGNDFVMLDNRDHSIQLSREQIALICDRHRGVGSDGLMCVELSNHSGVDFRMRYYNSDGGEAEMCGNGARCFSRFVQKLGECKDSLQFVTQAGIISGQIEENQVRINLSQPHGLRISEKVNLTTGPIEIHSINTGVPHAVVLVPDVNNIDVKTIGSEIRYHSHFSPKGTNVNFAQCLGESKIRVRTYERGVEDETLACGTGVTACALIAHQQLRQSSPIRVLVQGGDTLEVGFQSHGTEFSDVTLKGPADFTFEGEITL